MPERFFTPPEAAELLGVGHEKVLAWIHSGELTASNLATNPDSERPRWRISEDDLGKLLIRRRHVPEQGATRRRRRKTTTSPTYFE